MEEILKLDIGLDFEGLVDDADHATNASSAEFAVTPDIQGSRHCTTM